MVVALTILLLMMGNPANAEGNGKGVKLEISLGSPTLTITNPDGTKASYGGLGGTAKGFIPILADKGYRFDFTGGFRYLDFENKANNDNQSEYAQYLGPGLGLEVAVSRFFIGADYFLLRGRHTTLGVYSEKTEFDLTGLNYYAGLRIEFGTGALGFAWSQMASTISGGDVDISGNSKWSNTVYWLQFTYNFKTDTGKFVEALIGK